MSDRCQKCGDRLCKDGSCTTCIDQEISDATQGVLDAADAWYAARSKARGALDGAEEALAAAVERLGRAYTVRP